MGQDKSSSKDTKETILKVLSVIWIVVWTIVKWCLITGFWFCFSIIAFTLALGGVSLPQPRYIPKPGGRKINPKQAKEQIRREVKRKQSKKFLDEYEDMLMRLQQEEMERLQREQFEEQEKKERLESLSIRERILLKIRENPGSLLEDILTEEEMEELIFMILEVLL
ncbi:MAG TPA: hypothetical protein DCY88_28760 [Cyanobacteria bacterium UBA11372]|nr:hypothetical protein [Cyanobacteria bacterium UBA11372]